MWRIIIYFMISRGCPSSNFGAAERPPSAGAAASRRLWRLRHSCRAPLPPPGRARPRWKQRRLSRARAPDGDLLCGPFPDSLTPLSSVSRSHCCFGLRRVIRCEHLAAPTLPSPSSSPAARRCADAAALQGRRCRLRSGSGPANRRICRATMRSTLPAPSHRSTRRRPAPAAARRRRQAAPTL